MATIGHRFAVPPQGSGRTIVLPPPLADNAAQIQDELSRIAGIELCIVDLIRTAIGPVQSWSSRTLGTIRALVFQYTDGRAG